MTEPCQRGPILYRYLVVTCDVECERDCPCDLREEIRDTDASWLSVGERN